MKPYIRQFVKIVSKKNISPEYVTLFVTNQCNMKCKHCFYWKDINSQDTDLSCGEFEKISKNMDDFLFLLITGGEPFIRKDIPEIISIFYNNNNIRKLSIMTNGYFTEKIADNVKEVLKRCPKLQLILNISIDGIGDRHDEFRDCRGSFQKIAETIGELKKIKNIYPKLSIAATHCYSNYNQGEFINTYCYVRDVLRVDSFNCPLLRGTPRIPSIRLGDIEIYKTLIRLMHNDIINKRLRRLGNSVMSNLIYSAKFIATGVIIKTLENMRYLTPCYAGRINAVIYPNGDIFPCELLDKKIGSLRQAKYNFKQLWLSEKSKGIINRIKDTRCYCTHGCNMLSNIIYNPRYIPGIFINFIGLFQPMAKLKEIFLSAFLAGTRGTGIAESKPKRRWFRERRRKFFRVMNNH